MNAKGKILIIDDDSAIRSSLSFMLKRAKYGHQAVSVMLSCNGIVLNYAFVLYNKLSELAAELSVTHKNFDLVTVKGRNSSLTPTMSTLPA